MMAAELDEFKDIYAGALTLGGHWIVGNVEGSLAWPTVSQEVTFRGQTLHIIPVTKDRSPAIAIRRPADISDDDARRTINGFLSSLSWIESGSVTVKYWSGGGHASPMARSNFGQTIQTRPLDLSDLPQPDDAKARLVLALRREGLTLNHPGYQFLSLYRAFEVRFEDGRRRGAWINAALNDVSGHRAKEVLADLKSVHADVGRHLYETRRGAIAHARGATLDPDDPMLLNQFAREIPLMIELANMLIEREYNIPSRSKIYREHLYELAGFKAVIGEATITSILGGELSPGAPVNVPEINVGLLHEPTYGSLQALEPIHISKLTDGQIELVFEAKSKRTSFRFVLDFDAQRLAFEIDSDFRINDDGSAESALDIAEAYQFLLAYLGNGSLRITSAEDGSLLSRKDPFIPLNAMVNVEGLNANIERWRTEAENRNNSAA